MSRPVPGLAEAQRRVYAGALRRTSDTLAHIQESIAALGAEEHGPYIEQAEAIRTQLRALARQLEHHGQVDLFGDLQPIIPNEPFRTWNDRGQP